MLAQFNRLMKELMDGNCSRNVFRAWEIELFLNIESCEIAPTSRREVLRRYQKAAQRHIEKGSRLPLKLSEYLEPLKARRDQHKPPGAHRPVQVTIGIGSRE